MYHSGQDVDKEKGYACVRREVYGKSLYLPLNFAVNLKNSPFSKSLGQGDIKEN